MKKNLFAFLMVICVFISSVCMNVNAVESVPTENPSLEIKAKSAVLMEPETGKVLYELNPDEKLPCASVTKVMTLLLVVEAIDSGALTLEDNVTTSTYASKMGGSQIWLKEGEVMTVNELLKATFVASANDAAVALGEAVAGSNDAFVTRMNERAQELGMSNTLYKNATGLDDPEHLTTARDIAIVSSEILKHEIIKDYTLIWMEYLRDGKTELVNTNKLLKRYTGITGLKTGTTSTAGNCLSATAERDGMKLVSVVLGAGSSEDRFSGATKMLDYGFANFEVATPSFTAEMLEPVKVLSGMKNEVSITSEISSRLLVPKSRGADIVVNVEISEDISAPVEKGQNVGKVTLTLDETILGEYTVVTIEEIPPIKMWSIFKKIIKTIFCG